MQNTPISYANSLVIITNIISTLRNNLTVAAFQTTAYWVSGSFKIQKQYFTYINYINMSNYISIHTKQKALYKGLIYLVYL